MDAKAFFLFWVGGTLGVLTYAGIDLWSNPRLSSEVEFTMVPDLSRIPDLAHWGGRLMHHGAWPLLLTNAVILGGVVALAMAFLLRPRKVPQEAECVVAYDEEAPITQRSPESPPKMIL